MVQNCYELISYKAWISFFLKGLYPFPEIPGRHVFAIKPKFVFDGSFKVIMNRVV
ncbi:MAG: hypothetical protein ACFFD2_29875 [Promethearchaeota archaeon]